MCIACRRSSSARSPPRAARCHRGRHPAVDRVVAPKWTPRSAARITAVPGGAGGDGAIPVVRAGLCAAADWRARHRRLLEHADDLDPDRSAARGAIAGDGDRDHVYRYRAGWRDYGRDPVGALRTPDGHPDYGRPRSLWIGPGLEETY